MKTFKKICTFLLTVIAFAGFLAHAAPVSAEESFTTGSVTVTFKSEETRVSGAHFSIARVADLDQDRQKYTVLDAYSSVHADFEKTTAANYAKMAEQFAALSQPEQEGVTGDAGQLIFANLEKGMYVIWQTGAEGMARNYETAQPLLISVPNWDGKEWINDPEVQPKTQPAVLRGKVKGLKSWEGDSDVIRPDSITLHLFANDEEVAETTASKDTDWKFEFDGVAMLDENGQPLTFTVKEDVPAGYRFSIVNYRDNIDKKSPAVIINVKNTYTPEITNMPENPDTENPGKPSIPDVLTGDNGRILKFMAVIATAGILLIVLAAEKKKKRKESTK